MNTETLYFKIKKIIKSHISLTNIRRIQKFLSFFAAHNLLWLASINATDKWNIHRYAIHYQHHFKKFRLKKCKILEIGVGGYASPIVGGNSLRMWRSYFRNSMIYSVDIHDKSLLQEDRIKIFQGSQADEVFLKELALKEGPFDIIIDDGSHINSHVILTFETLYPYLKNGGIYAVEDMQTSYWPVAGGDSDNFENPLTMMGYFKKKIDSLNFQEFLKPGYTPNYYDKHIVSMHFYHNLMFIYKAQNDECSNIVKDNEQIIC